MKEKKNFEDPYADREALRYEHPIPSRELILKVLAEKGHPMTLRELVDLLGLEDEKAQEALRRRLRAMERDGQLVCNRRGAYVPIDHSELVRGRVIGHPDGFGFLVPDEGGDDVFLSPRQMRQLLHGDRALVRIVGIDRRGRPEGAVIEVLERANEQVVGRFFMEGGVGFVVPDNKRLSQDILIPRENMDDAAEGQIVVADIIEQPSKRSKPLGRIAEVLGDHMAPGMEIDIAIRSHGIPYEWPPEVTAQAATFGVEVDEEAKEGRVDLRDVALVTIDGEDARDFDDAVYCEPLGDRGWRLLVAIADVSSYVEVADPLDEEARKRGTSVYFPERVVPMLPEVLSNGLCSLNPKVDRLCMVCEMRIDRKGKVKKYEFYEGVMRSAARLTYTDVAAMVVDRKATMRRKYRKLVGHLDDLHELYKALHEQRIQRGAMDLDSTETRIVFGADRKIERVVPVERNDAHRMIEECMISANVCAAVYMLEHKIPTLYRVHDGPSEDRLEDLRGFLAELGLSLGGGKKPRSKDFARLVEQIRGRPDAHLIQTVLLRSLTQAVYSPNNIGHFGLALKAYAHFTSPIRRHPDLLVHRAIRYLLRHGNVANFDYSPNDMVGLGEHCSMTERRADEATRDAVDWLKCEYMMDKVGEEFDGIISSVISFGLFVELNDIYVEGLVHVTSLENDYYRFDPVGHRLTGERGGKVYRLGDAIRVRVVRVDLDEKKIDFVVAGGSGQGRSRPAKSGASKSRSAKKKRTRSKK